MPVLVPEVLDSSTMFAIVRSLEISLAAGTRLRRTAKVLGGGLLPGSTALVGCLELLLGWFWPANQRSDVSFRLGLRGIPNRKNVLYRKCSNK